MKKSDEIDWGGQAFPTEGGVNSGLYPDPGMSLRDWFAGQAMIGIIIGNNASISVHNLGAARDAYTIADHLIAARKEGSKP